MKPNIVFVLTDDQGTGDLGCHGNPWIQTPHIDRFHSESYSLTDFHVGPTCAPTRASLMTGRYANSTGVWHTVGGRSLLRRNEVSLADALAGAGYINGIFGKWHLGDNAPYRPQDRGFHKTLIHGGGGISQAPDWWGNDYFDDTYLEDGVPRSFEGYCTDVWFREAEKFIEENRNRPFFCYIAPNAPHEPYNIMREYCRPYEGTLEGRDSPKRERFYGMITHLDEQFGKLRETLRRLDLEETTILIFMTDNGTGGGGDFDEQGHLISGWNHGLRGKKGSEYDGGHRVPFFLRWPAGGVEGRQDIPGLTSVTDVMPTLLDLCGLQSSQELHGRSLLSELRDPSRMDEERVVVTDSQRVPHPVKWKQSAVMMGRWRLINGRELYDIRRDRAQREDLSDAYPDVIARMREGYEEWWTLVSPDFDGEIPIALGADGEIVRLSSHDWRNDDGEVVWNQQQVRRGLPFQGYWEVDVRAAGRYRIELCRWPREDCGKTLREGMDEEDLLWNREGVAPDAVDWYSGGRALPITRAEISLGDLKREIPARDHAVFDLPLTVGPAHLSALFRTEEGEAIGAYYCYVQKIG